MSCICHDETSEQNTNAVASAWLAFSDVTRTGLFSLNVNADHRPLNVRLFLFAGRPYPIQFIYVSDTRISLIRIKYHSTARIHIRGVSDWCRIHDTDPMMNVAWMWVHLRHVNIRNSGQDARSCLDLLAVLCGLDALAC
jgi:hypothetical protein